jgi:hypothetical protein
VINEHHRWAVLGSERNYGDDVVRMDVQDNKICLRQNSPESYGSLRQTAGNTVGEVDPSSRVDDSSIQEFWHVFPKLP